MHARTGTFQADPGQLEAMVDELRSEQLPRYHEQSGYKGFTVLADRQSGKVIGISFWETEADLEASDALGREAREQAAQTGGAGAEPVREAWEVMLDDMA
jgi:heme-degrading monooxygenase HmoA